MKTHYKVTLEELQELRSSDVLKGFELIARIQDRTQEETLKEFEEKLRIRGKNKMKTQYIGRDSWEEKWEN